MNVLSLFAGIGGIELGLERAGMSTVGQVEIDPFCTSVLAARWPDVPRHDDVRTAVEWWQGATRPDVHVVCGGFPCQPFSGAARGVHTAENLWPAMFGVIDALRPPYVLGENVAALLRKREFGVIIEDLAGIGYDAEWSVVSACAFGATHSRKRLYLVAYPHGDREPVLQVDGQVAGDCTLPAIGEAPLSGDLGMDDGLPDRVDRHARLRALGNSVVPQISHHIGGMIMNDFAAALPQEAAA